MKKVLQRALKLRRPKGCTHLAVLFKGSRVVQCAWNNTKKTKAICARLGFSYSTPHAEVAAVLEFVKKHSKKDLRKCSMLVLRYTRNGELRASKPCDQCMYVLKEDFPVRRVLWLDDSLEVKDK